MNSILEQTSNEKQYSSFIASSTTTKGKPLHHHHTCDYEGKTGEWINQTSKIVERRFKIAHSAPSRFAFSDSQ